MKRFIATLTLMMILGTCLRLPSAFADTIVDETVTESATAYMEIEFECGCTRTGAGAMIAKNALVTASHNLVCMNHTKKVKSITFNFGYWGAGTAMYKYTGAFTYRYYERFVNGFNSADDIGYVVFPENVGEKTGWFASKVCNDKTLKYKDTNFVGVLNDTVIYDYNQIDVYSDREITWKISDQFSKSLEGRPAYWNYDGLKYPTVIGVYTSHSDTNGFVRRLTNQIINDMKKDGAKFN